MEINIAEKIGKGYKSYWNYTGRYNVLKGGRGSKKSVTTSIRIIYNMMKYYHNYGLKPCTLVIRRFHNTHRDSTYSQLKWAINYLGVSHLWKIKKATLVLEYLPSGQKILFRGLDNPESITSITVEDGQLCWVWWEEFFQIESEDAFNKIDMSIRGDMPKPLYKQHMITFNPWSANHFAKARFFDIKNDNVLAQTTTYKINEFLGEDDIALFEEMKAKNPRRYDIEGEGNWGIAEGQVYNNFRVEDFDIRSIIHKKGYVKLHGLDFGFVNDPTAYIGVAANQVAYKLYVYDEFYGIGMTNSQIERALKERDLQNEIIEADSAEQRTINELRLLGVNGVRPCKKGAGSVIEGIQKLQDFEIIVHPRCENTIIELNNYVFEKNKAGRIINQPIDDFNHLMDALRYATRDLRSRKFGFK